MVGVLEGAVGTKVRPAAAADYSPAGTSGVIPHKRVFTHGPSLKVDHYRPPLALSQSSAKSAIPDMIIPTLDGSK